MRQQAIGTLIGATGGTAFVLANAGAPLGSALTTAARVLAVVLLAAVLVVTFRQTGKPAADKATGGFTKGYWFVVLAEVVALFGGFQVLRALEAPVQANIAWIAVVVGIHFVAFVPVWKTWTIAVPGVVMTILGGIGLAMVWTSAVAWVPIVSGVLSGLTLLLCGLFFTARRA
ncbi:hypothetical protein NLX83_38990 [Allokutzneria sp. A3M-2-11 16]|uniref:hypothetical protein n=1 Tax=Allokutzneria sp. A3M-2-11 16 TaxID=2962043 RepID=UPI0020B8531F|nr:hypothetical protein [Allokutzneria sp. A3M-2-11 16]MCP3805269.1 hypothetical protein [Allokutzneria sp. A3M-2-11 16]